MLIVLISSIFLYCLSQSVASGRINILLRNNYYIINNILSIMLVIEFFYIIFGSYKISFIISSILIYILSLTMYYVHEFRGTNINFSDILSLNTAKEVAAGYKYKVKIASIICLLLLLSVMICIGRISIDNDFVKNILYNNFGFDYLTQKLVSIVIFIILFLVLRSFISKGKYDYSLNAGEKEGYVYNFFTSIFVFHKKSDNDTSVKAKIVNENEDNEDYLNIYFTNNSQDITNINNNDSNVDRPHIITIMNESFGSIHDKINANIEITPYYNALKNVSKGNLYVNTFGGGTANTEFEFLTGMSIGNYEYPVMPYNNFVKRDKYSLARYFKNIGYKTEAIHPYTATNYHRDKVYKRFGFDELLFFDEFKNKSYVRNFISDEAFYRECILRFENAIKHNEKLFLFGITMQNHSGYMMFDEAKVVSNLDFEEKESLDAYLSLMRISDDALKILFDYFGNVKEHVIILFFGDHNASFGTEINKYLYGDAANYEYTIAYKTPVFIYDNKVDYNKSMGDISANFLSIKLLNYADLPLDEFHKFLNDIYINYPVYNFHKRLSIKDGKLYDILDDNYMKLEREYLK